MKGLFCFPFSRKYTRVLKRKWGGHSLKNVLDVWLPMTASLDFKGGGELAVRGVHSGAGFTISLKVNPHLGATYPIWPLDEEGQHLLCFGVTPIYLSLSMEMWSSLSSSASRLVIAWDGSSTKGLSQSVSLRRALNTWPGVKEEFNGQ